jgi:tetratricopeptide (TPR) repeat protein
MEEMARAIRALCLALALSPAVPATGVGQSSPKAAMLEQAGWEALKAGQPQSASDAFREAIALDPKNARLYLGAGTAAFVQRRDTEAKEAFERALVLDPRLTRARALLGQVLRRGGDLQTAIREYETVVAELPGDEGARETLARWRREAELHDRMQQAIGDHFTVSFEGPEDATQAERALASLDKAYWRICEVFGAYPTAPVAVVLYTAEQFRDITRAPQWSAGAYDGRIRVPMRGAGTNLQELDRVLAHEFVHALIRNLTDRGVPAWLNEGLAAALERDDLAWARTRVQKASAVPTLADLQTGFGRFSGAQAQLAYATSALAAQRLLEIAGGTAITNLLRDLGEDVEFETAFEHRIQQSFAEFQARFGQ